MDLLDKINSLTDDQLRTVAERDDASGVLASYRLAELRGLPCPDRTAVIMGDGYAIVAQGGVIQRIATEGVTKIIREEDGEFCVYSEDGSRSFGCYPSMDQAEERLREIHYFENEIEVEDEADINKESFVPPEGAQEAGQRALDWLAEGHAGSGFTDVGRARAAQLARGDALSEETIRRMASFLARHEGDSRAEGFSSGEEGFPSAGRVAWDAWGGDAGKTWADMMVERFNREEKVRPVGKATMLRKADEKQFTLGPLYVPDFIDAHGEWTDSEELQNAVWGWVRSGDRRIFLQHDRDVVAGEWVEVMTMPQPWTVEMMDAAGVKIGEVTYPVDTVFLGVVWNDSAWADVKAGRLRGYSIGGLSDRLMADLPANGERDGIEMDA